MKLFARSRLVASQKQIFKSLLDKLQLGSKEALLLKHAKFDPLGVFFTLPQPAKLTDFTRPLSKVLGAPKVYKSPETTSYHWYLNSGIISIGQMDAGLVFAFHGDLTEMFKEVD